MSANGGAVAVLIVGGGPVGLALANELGWRGISCMLVERRDGTVGHPRMNQVSARTMEYCRRWGIAERVRAASIPEDFPRAFSFATSANGYRLARFAYPARKDIVPVHSPESIQRCSQLWFDPILQERAQSLEPVTLRHATELSGFSQDGDGVTAELIDTESGGAETVRAHYLAACDGAESAVRETLGIALEGDETLSHEVNILFRSTDFDALLPGEKAVMQWMFGADGLWADIVAIDGRELWRCGLNRFAPGATVGKADAAEYIRRAAGRDFDFEVISVLPWTRRRVVAERYRDGRVFLVGDSAHQMSPTGGFGMNTGIAEAVDLGWKLAAVLDGWGGPGLLDSYEAERRPVAIRVTDEGARNFAVLAGLPHGPEIDQDSPEGARLRERITHIITNNGFDREYDTDGIILGYRYEGSPICRPDGTDAPPDEVMTYVPTARPGHRAPHGWLADGRSTLDLFGRGFTLLRFGAPGVADGLIAAASARAMPLDVIDIDAGAIGDLYERRLVLVRPDGHVAWRGDAAPTDAAALIDRVRGA